MANVPTADGSRVERGQAGATTHLLRVVVVIAVLLVVLFIALRLLSMRDDLLTAPALQRPWLLPPAFLLYAAALFTYVLLWREIICRLDKARAPVLDYAAVFCASWLGRYVPSSLPYVAGKVAMGARLGHRASALVVSVLYENALIVALGAVSSSILIPIALAGDGGGLLVYAGAGLGGVAALALLSPPVFQRLINVAAPLVGQPRISRADVLSYRGMLACSALAGVALALNGAGFALVLGSFVELSVREVVATAAIFNLAGVVGFAVLPVPSGLGVREAVLIGLLQLYVPIEVAAAAAVLARLCGIVVDVAFGLAGAALFALRQRAPASAGEEPRSQRQLDAA